MESWFIQNIDSFDWFCGPGSHIKSAWVVEEGVIVENEAVIIGRSSLLYVNISVQRYEMYCSVNSLVPQIIDLFSFLLWVRDKHVQE